MFLKDAKAIATQTNSARTHCVKSLNNLIFENDSGRLNKKELREFTVLISRNTIINLQID